MISGSFYMWTKGEVEVMADDTGYCLKQGEMIFHKPGEFHNVFANGLVAPNLVVVAFVCASPRHGLFRGQGGEGGGGGAGAAGPDRP